jgi:hypothetical protein
MQNTQGDDDGEQGNFMGVAIDLYRKEGLGVFYDGITPKCIRAGVNHSVTFFVYDLLMKALAGSSMGLEFGL